MFGALKRGFRSMTSLILVRNVVGELRPKRTLAASRGFLAASRLSCLVFLFDFFFIHHLFCYFTSWNCSLAHVMLLVIILKHNDVLFLYGLCSVYKCNFCPLLMHVSDCWLLDLIVLQKCLYLRTFYIKRLVSRCRSHTSSLLERTSLFSFVALPYRGLCFRSVCLFVSPSFCLYVG